MIFPSTPFSVFPFPRRWIPILKFHRPSFLPLSFPLFLVPNSDFELEPNQILSFFFQKHHAFSFQLLFVHTPLYSLVSLHPVPKHPRSQHTMDECVHAYTCVCYLPPTSLPARTIFEANCFQVWGQISGFPWGSCTSSHTSSLLAQTTLEWDWGRGWM